MFCFTNFLAARKISRTELAPSLDLNINVTVACTNPSNQGQETIPLSQKKLPSLTNIPSLFTDGASLFFNVITMLVAA